MSNLLFILICALILAVTLPWAFKHLPGARWQVLASLPLHRQEDGSWRAVNLTFYGLLNALATMAGVAWCLLLLGAVGLSPLRAAAFLGPLLALCLPAAGLVARLVEGKRHTLSIGGASFVGLVLGPPFAWLLLHFWEEGRPPLAAVMASMGLAYCLGEGLGRLSCISFGCCYGKPLEQSPALLKKLFARRHFVFTGPTKKISYAAGWEGVPMVPLQAISSVILLSLALAGTYLFLEGRYIGAMLLPIVGSQLWRAASEFLRADYRGDNPISAYQIMAVLASIYYLVLGWLLPRPVHPSDLASGLAGLWQPGAILAVAGLGLVVLLHTGLSKVTGAQVCLHVHQDRI